MPAVRPESHVAAIGVRATCQACYSSRHPTARMIPRRVGWLLLAALALSVFGQFRVAAQSRARVYEVDLAHGVTPPAAGLVGRAIHEATAANATALIVKIEGSGTVLRTAWTLARDLNA